VDAAPPRRHWLLKSEPSVFAFDDLWRAPRRRSGWEGVRNYQARNLLRDELRAGDGVLFYHSSSEPPGIAGIARVSASGRPDPSQFDAHSEYHDPAATRVAPRWYEVEIEAVAQLPTLVTLAELRAEPALAGMALLRRGQRLSVLPVSPAEWRAVLALAGLADPLAR
jgi:predicted RNA-binding protein with PUA-like domain